MLEELNVRNYALIENVSVRFNEGFNILTGETGAGKSILIGALGLLLGEKGETSVVRTGAEEAEVSGVIRIGTNEEVVRWVEDHGIVPEEGTVIIRRILKANGRGSIFVQSSPIPRADLQELSSLLFDVHGQHEHQSLLNTDAHRKLTDRFGGFEDLASGLRGDFLELSGLKKRLSDMNRSEQDRMRETDILGFAIREIEEAGLTVGEEEELEQERRKLSQYEKLFELLEEYNRTMADSHGGIMTGLRQSRQHLQSMSTIDLELEELSKRFENAFFEVEDITESVKRYQGDLQFSPERLETIQERLALIHRLQKKYGPSEAAVIEYAETARTSLDELENEEQGREELRESIKTMERRVLTIAAELSRKRSEAAGRLQSEIRQNLRVLGIPNAEFEVRIDQKKSDNGRPVCGPNGFDSLEFLISPNKGEPLKPLRSVASGGEISRIMLAIKSVLADTDHIDCLIFDEIDAGIGGEVSVAVGTHLHELAAHKQILCITHLPTIAVRAGNHLTVEKREDGGRTMTEIRPVTGADRVREIARMLSGDKHAEASLKHAEDLLRKFGTVATRS